jgi:hypothetical protein
VQHERLTRNARWKEIPIERELDAPVRRERDPDRHILCHDMQMGSRARGLLIVLGTLVAPERGREHAEERGRDG